MPASPLEVIVLCVLSLFVCSRFMSYSQSIFLCLFRFGFSYFYFDGLLGRFWTLKDDVHYFYTGTLLKNLGYNPITALTTASGLKDLETLAQGHHILYGWFNLLSIWIFGPAYSSPVLMNIFVTFLISAMLFETLVLLGCKRIYASAAAVFFLLNPTVIAWTSFLDLKDALVMLLVMVALFGTLRIQQKKYGSGLTCLISGLFFLLWIRYYLPLLIVGTVAVWLASSQRGWHRVGLFLVAIAMAFGAMMMLGSGAIDPYLHQLYLADLITGPFHELITPVPWNTGYDYSFLMIPQSIEWLLMIPAAWAAVNVWRRSNDARLFLYYFLAVLILYGIAVALQGPRERFQAEAILSWLQFHGCYLAWRSLTTSGRTEAFNNGCMVAARSAGQ